MPNLRSAIQDLNPKAEEYIDARLAGKTAAESAEYAGYSPRTNVENTPAVRDGLSRAQAELAANYGLTRGDIIVGMQDAIRIAKIANDPQSMIKGFSEIAKILGFYAPEEKRVNLTMSQERMQRGLENMSDEALLKMAEDGVYEP